MTDVGVFWDSIIVHGGTLLLMTLAFAVVSVLLTQFMRGTEQSKFRMEMLARSTWNIIFFALAVVFIYQSQRIGALATVLEEYHGRSASGEDPSLKTYPEELKYLVARCSRARWLGTAALTLTVGGFWLQIRRTKRQSSKASIENAVGHVDSPATT